jgi:HEAT repeat protein
MNNFFSYLFLILPLFSSIGQCQEPVSILPEAAQEEKISKLQIIYLAQSREYKKAIELYKKYKSQIGKNDFTVLEHLSKAILEQGSRSQDSHTQLLSIYASSLAGVSSPIDILEAGMSSTNMHTQLASLQLMARVQDDQIDYMLQKAMSSDFLYTRLEAAYILAARKSRIATGQVEALMHKLPPQLGYLFPELFALIGTSESMNILRHMMDDPFHPVRVEAILSAARHGRDDLLPTIRSCSTHVDIAEQEACAAALGYLKDSASLKRLKKLSLSPSDNVKLAALQSLHCLGDLQAKQEIIEMAKNKNLFAITLLGDISDSEDTLLSLAHDENLSIKLNAALALLKRKDPRSIIYLKEFLLRDSRDIGFQPYSSTGNSLRAWKVISSTQQHAKQSYYDLMAISLSVRESILVDALELSEDAFINIAKIVMDYRQNELIPVLVHLLENHKGSKALELLKTRSQSAGAPLLRAYCNLALYRLKEKGPYKENMKSWVQSKQSQEIVQFRHSLPWAAKLNESNFELTPQENSALLIESYQVLAEEHTEESIDFLLDSLHQGQPANIPILAGILLKALQ